MPHAIAMFGHGLNPHYFANPPAFTYVLHFLFAIAYGGTSGVREAFALHPTDVYTLARVAAAVLGVAALWLLYAAGARLFGRAVGLLAAAIEAVAFLPVFYAHLALNDVPTLAPADAVAARHGRRRCATAACATTCSPASASGSRARRKYTAGIVLLPLLAAAAIRFLEDDARRARTPACARCSASRSPARSRSRHSSSRTRTRCSTTPPSTPNSCTSRRSRPKRRASSARRAKAASPTTCGRSRGGSAGCRRSRRSAARSRSGAGGRALGWLLVPAPLLFLAFMGLQGRYFGRWLLPIFPIVCLLAAFFVLELASALARLLRTRPRALALVPSALLVALVLAQGLLYSVHSGLVLSRADTRNLARDWMVAHIPAGAQIVVEPIVARRLGARTHGQPAGRTRTPYRWNKYAVARLADRARRRALAANCASSASRTTCARSARR